MAKITISRDRLIELRDEHMQFLESSAAAFDAGNIGEAKRMAVSLRVLFHETAQSHSILAQLGERQRAMIDTAQPYNPRNLLTHHGLVGAVFGSETRYYAPLGGLPSRWLRFSDWWEKDIVIKAHSKQFYTRRSLILFAANKDGGAHVDPHLDTSLEKLKDGSAMGWTFLTEGPHPWSGRFLPDVQAHSIRQIAYEALQSLMNSPPP